MTRVQFQHKGVSYDILQECSRRILSTAKSSGGNLKEDKYVFSIKPEISSMFIFMSLLFTRINHSLVSRQGNTLISIYLCCSTVSFNNHVSISVYSYAMYIVYRISFVQSYLMPCISCISFVQSYLMPFISCISFVQSYLMPCISCISFVKSYLMPFISCISFVQSYLMPCISCISFLQSYLMPCISCISFLQFYFLQFHVRILLYLYCMFSYLEPYHTTPIYAIAITVPFTFN